MVEILIGYAVPVIHVLCCLFLIVVVLLQTGKGADIGAVFGGGSQTLFGSGGAGNFLTRLTTGMVIAFMITSLILTWGADRAPRSSLFDRLDEPAAQTEQAPAQADAGAPAAGTEGDAPAAGTEPKPAERTPPAPAEAPAEPAPSK